MFYDLIAAAACFALGAGSVLLTAWRAGRRVRPGSVVPYTARDIGTAIGLTSDETARLRARGLA